MKLYPNALHKEIAYSLYDYDIIKAKKLIETLDNSKTKNLFNNEIYFIEKGLYVLPEENYESDFLNEYSKISIANQLFSLSKNNYQKAYEILTNVQNKSKDKYIKNLTCRSILRMIQVNQINFNQFQVFLNHLKINSSNAQDKFWYQYFSLYYDFFKNYLNDKHYFFNANKFDDLAENTKLNYLKAMAYQLKSVVLNCQKKYDEALKYEEISFNYYNKDKTFIAKLSMLKISMNKANNLTNLGLENEALHLLNLTNKNPIADKDLNFKSLLYNSLYLAHQKKKNIDSAIFYYDLKIKLDEKIKVETQKLNIHIINTKYQLKEKNKQITTLNQKFQKNKILYLTLILITFLLALYSFVRWKKEDKKKKTIENEKAVLEFEHHQTIEELQKTKQLVIEDHIVLKNKAKIYLEELIYIKAEDHYLELITTNKKEFVRGKLSEIIDELPPNFVKCHRSFIINKNFIKQLLKTEMIMKNNDSVPVSRSFKMN